MASPLLPTSISTQQKPALLKAGIILFLLLFTLILYTFAHESSHALLGLLFGGQLSSFSVSFWDLSAHAGLVGDFNDAQRSLISLAGVSLPLILWMMFLVFIAKKTNPVLEWFKLVGSACVLNTLLAWIIIPFLYIAERAPGDDSTNFLRTSGMPPLLVASLALMVYVYGWVLFLSRQEGARGILARLRFSTEQFLTTPSRKTLVAMALTALLVTLFGLAISNFYPFADALAAPKGYTPAFSLDLSSQGYDSQTVYRFSLDAPAEVSLFFALKDFTSGPVRITLLGPDGYNNTFLRANADFKVGESTVHPQPIPLAAGAYRIEMTCPQSAAKVSGYMKTEAAR